MNMVLQTIEKKGLGRKLGEMPTSLGRKDIHKKYAQLIQENENDKFNIRIIDNSFESSWETNNFYVFPQLVSEEEARKKYDELN